MSPLPTSLIVVGLVAAWLVVLVPMVAKRREHVPESDENSAGFRVLRRASKSPNKRRPVLSRTAVAADAADAADADDRFDGDEDRLTEGDERDWGSDEWGERDGEEDDADVVTARDRAEFGDEDSEGRAEERDLDAGDERADGPLDEDETRFGGDEIGGDEDAENGLADNEYAGGEYSGAEYAGAEYAGAEYADDRRDGDADLVARIDPGDLDDARYDDDRPAADAREDLADPRGRRSGEHVLTRQPSRRPQRPGARPRRAPVSADEQPMLDDRWGEVDDSRHRRTVRDAADEWTAEHPQRRRADAPRAPRPRAAEPRWQADPEWGARDRGEDAWDDAREPIRGARNDREEEARLRPVPIRPGRGGFDPRAAEQAKAFRYRQRRRVVLLLLALVVIGAAAGVLGISLAWAGAVVAAVLLAMYLAYLRRQVRIEESIRQRRAARLERARQIRPAYRASVAEQVRAHRTGSVRRPDADEEPEESAYRVRSHAHPTSTVPPALYTRGVPVDLDDDDPAFDDLEYYRPVTYRRAVGE